jgi:hypothetical protein
VRKGGPKRSFPGEKGQKMESFALFARGVLRVVLIANDLLDIEKLSLAIESIRSGDEAMTAVQQIRHAKSQIRLGA